MGAYLFKNPLQKLFYLSYIPAYCSIIYFYRTLMFFYIDDSNHTVYITAVFNTHQDTSKYPE